MALFLSAFFIPKRTLSQDNIELVFARNVSDAPGYKNVTLAKGNVQFKNGNTKLFCDSAIWFNKEQIIHAYGRVQINQGDTLNLFCDSLKYDGNTNISKLKGNVRLRDNEYKLVTDSLDFDGNKSRGYYTNWATISSINKDLTLKSIKGYYYSNSKSFFFKDSVHVMSAEYELFSDTLEFRTNSSTVHFHGPTQILLDSMEILCNKGIYYTDNGFIQLWNGAIMNEKNRTFYADSIIYYQDLGTGEGFYNVNMYDSTENIQFLSEYLFKSAEDDSIILKNDAIVIQFHKNDTLYIAADTIIYTQDTITKLNATTAQNNVAILNGDIRVACDSAYFNEKDSIVKLLINPIMWSKNTQMTSDSIEALFYDDEFHIMYLYENAMIIADHEDSNYFDQIKGKNMTAYLDSSKIQKVFIEYNAQTLYFVAESKSDSLMHEYEEITGMNKIDCNEIIIYFKDSEINTIAFIDEPTSVFYPIDLVPVKELFLRGFLWEIDRKPEPIFIK